MGTIIQVKAGLSVSISTVPGSRMIKVSFRKGCSAMYDPQLGKWLKNDSYQQDMMELIPISYSKNIRLLERELNVFAEARAQAFASARIGAGPKDVT
jgi:hypothetical protein